MRRFLMVLALSGCAALAQPSYTLEITLNGQTVPFTVQAPARLERGAIHVAPDQDIVVVQFQGGWLELNLADWQHFNFAHVLGAQFQRTGEDTYTVSATVRHADTGWDDYANLFRIVGTEVEHGERKLLHPHVEEQPFTRSQAGVQARGAVQVEAHGSLSGWGGSVIGLELPIFADQRAVAVSYTLSSP